MTETETQGISLLDLLLALARRKRLLVGAPLLAAVLAIAASFLLSDEYTATARILPPQQSSTSASAAMLAQLAGAAAILGSAAPGKPSDLYTGMMKGHTIADRLIKRFKLQELYEKNTVVETRRELAKRTDIVAGRDGIISISVEDESPKRAAELANAYAEELQQLAQGMALTEAAQRRVFFEQQLQQAREQLARAEGELKNTQEQTGLIQLDQQGRAIIEAIAKLRAEIAAKEVQIAAFRTFATDTNPEIVLLRQQLSGLRSELSKLERSPSANPGEVLIPTGKVPEAGLEYIRRMRELKYHEAIMELLAKQYEIARLDEAKDVALIQFVDRAVPPDRKSGPNRGLIALAAAFIVAVLALLWAVVAVGIARIRQDPVTDEKFRRLRGLLARP